MSVKQDAYELSAVIKYIVEDNYGDLPSMNNLVDQLLSKYQNESDIGILGKGRSRMRGGKIYDPRGVPYEISMLGNNAIVFRAAGYNGTYEGGSGDDLYIEYPIKN